MDRTRRRTRNKFGCEKSSASASEHLGQRRCLGIEKDHVSVPDRTRNIVPPISAALFIIRMSEALFKKHVSPSRTRVEVALPPARDLGAALKNTHGSLTLVRTIRRTWSHHVPLAGWAENVPPCCRARRSRQKDATAREWIYVAA